jgi:hypothetical protein
VLTPRIDLALEALILCRERLPFLRDLYRPGSPERVALDVVLDGLREADRALTPRRRERPSAAARPGGAG